MQIRSLVVSRIDSTPSYHVRPTILDDVYKTGECMVERHCSRPSPLLVPHPSSLTEPTSPYLVATTTMDPQQDPGCFFTDSLEFVKVQDSSSQYLEGQVTPAPTGTCSWEYPEDDWSAIPLSDPHNEPSVYQPLAEVPQFPHDLYVPGPWMPPQPLWSYPSQPIVSLTKF